MSKNPSWNCVVEDGASLYLEGLSQEERAPNEFGLEGLPPPGPSFTAEESEIVLDRSCPKI